MELVVSAYQSHQIMHAAVQIQDIMAHIVK